VLRTYSKRVNTTLETSSSKKRRVSELDDTHETLLKTSAVHSNKTSKVFQTSPESRLNEKHPENMSLTKAITNLHHIISDYGHSQRKIESLNSERLLGSNYPDNLLGVETPSKPAMPPQSAPAKEMLPQQAASLNQASDENLCLSGNSDCSQQLNTCSSSTSEERPAEALTHSNSSIGTETFNNSSTQGNHPVTKNRRVEDACNVESFATITPGPPKNDVHATVDIAITTTKKRRVVDNTVDIPSPAAGSAPLPKKPKLSGIHNYFKPLPHSSSPTVSSSPAIQSSDSIGPPEDITPPSSPPEAEHAILVHEKRPQKRQRRRLTTRPTLEPLNNMSYHSRRSYFDDDDRQSFSEIIGGVNDPARVRIAEAHLDDEEKDDLVRSQMVSPGNRPRSDSYGSRSTGSRSSNMNARPFPSPPITRVSESLRRSASNPGPNRGGNRSFIGGGRGSGALPGPSPSPRIGSCSEAGPSSFPSAPTRQRSVTTGNYNLYDHDEAPEYGPNRALYEKPNGRELAPYKPSHTIEIPPASRKRNESSGYQQLQLDLGVKQTITCVKCKMVYNPSVEMDKSHHDMYCRTYEMPELQQRIFANERPIYEKIVHGEQHHIRVFGRYSTQAQRAHARKVLDATYQDLPGLEYTDEELASEIPDPLQFDRANMVPRFKFYVYYIGRKVIGALLAERYHQSQSRQLVELGRGPPLQGKHIIFDRIWVSPSHRRLGYASKIADNARVTFIPGLVLPKEAVAMPEQTTMGKGFAKRYFA